MFLNLREYLATITAVSPKIIAARLDEAAAYYEAKSTYAAYLPHLVGNAGVAYIHGKSLRGFFNPFGGLPSSTTGDRWFTEEGPGLTIPIYRDGSFLGINVPPEVARKRAETQITKFKGSLTEQSVIRIGDRRLPPGDQGHTRAGASHATLRCGARRRRTSRE